MVRVLSGVYAEALIELTDHAGFAGWPTTPVAGSGHVPLHASLTVEEIGSVVWSSFLDGAIRRPGSVVRRGGAAELPSKRWQARYTGPDDKTYSARTEYDKPLTFLTEGDVREWLKGVQSAISREEWLPPAKAYS